MAVSPLEFVGLRRLPPLEAFVVADWFGSTEPIGSMDVAYLGEHFRTYLLPLREEPVPAALLREHTLRIEACDVETRKAYGVLKELGGETWAPITLGQLWTCLLATDRRRRHMAYVRTSKNVFGVGVGWVDPHYSMRKGLYVESGPLYRPYPWAEDTIVLSQ
ncbi:hypothetical protein HYW59_02720 [Candidatus Kaiserbacteria bacterium]|nr:hypothetical protein [Candidatus Kaiserbacteria bacterium]